MFSGYLHLHQHLCYNLVAHAGMPTMYMYSEPYCKSCVCHFVHVFCHVHFAPNQGICSRTFQCCTNSNLRDTKSHYHSCLLHSSMYLWLMPARLQCMALLHVIASLVLHAHVYATSSAPSTKSLSYHCTRIRCNDGNTWVASSCCKVCDMHHMPQHDMSRYYPFASGVST